MGKGIEILRHGDGHCIIVFPFDSKKKGRKEAEKIRRELITDLVENCEYPIKFNEVVWNEKCGVYCFEAEGEEPNLYVDIEQALRRICRRR